MPKSLIVDGTAFDAPADINPGVYSSAVFDAPTEAGAESKPKGLTTSQKIAKYSGYLPTAGAFVGGGLSALAAPGTAGASLLGGSALAGLGAAAGKAGEQLIKRAVGEDSPDTTVDAAKEIVKEGAWTAALNMAGGKLIEKLGPSLKLAGKQILKGFARIDERAAMKVLNDPNILTRAKPLAQAKEDFSNFFKSSGYEYGSDALKYATGKRTLSDQAADDFITDVIVKIEGKVHPSEIPFVTQEALAARYGMKDAIKRAARSGNNDKARVFIQAKNQVDDWIESNLPGFSAVRKEYEESKIKQAFEPLFPLNKNNETSVLGVITSLGSTLGAGGVFGPTAAIPGAIVSSPKIAGIAIKAADKLGNKATGAGVSELISKYITPEVIKAEYKAGKLDKSTAAQMLRENHGFQ